MKKEELYEILGEMDENAVADAKSKPHKAKKRKVRYLISAIACVGIVFTSVIMFKQLNSNPIDTVNNPDSQITVTDIQTIEPEIDNNSHEASSKSDKITTKANDKDDASDSREGMPNVSQPVISDEDTALECDNINIYYIKNNETLCVTEYMPMKPKYVFLFWKYYNGIGDNVELINVKIENNGTENDDSLAANYIAGDKYIMNVTVTANLRDYFEILPEEELINTLKRSLTEYSGDDIAEFNLFYN